MHDERLLGAIALSARGQLGLRFGLADLAHLAWAVATVGADPRAPHGFPHGDELLAELARVLGARVALAPDALSALSQREAAQLVWALAIDGQLAPAELASALFAAVVTTPVERDAVARGAAPAREHALVRIEVRRGRGALASVPSDD